MFSFIRLQAIFVLKCLEVMGTHTQMKEEYNDYKVPNLVGKVRPFWSQDE